MYIQVYGYYVTKAVKNKIYILDAIILPINAPDHHILVYYTPPWITKAVIGPERRRERPVT